MAVKKTKRNVLQISSFSGSGTSNSSRTPIRPGSRRKHITISSKGLSLMNKYVCAIETNQNGKYNLRIRVIFGKDEWTLPVYSLASTFNGAMKKLEESLQFLQKNEEKLRFWGLERSDDPNFAGDLLSQTGMMIDRRKDLPRKSAELALPSERPVTAAMIGTIRRTLADSVIPGRFSAASNY